MAEISALILTASPSQPLAGAAVTRAWSLIPEGLRLGEQWLADQIAWEGRFRSEDAAHAKALGLGITRGLKGQPIDVNVVPTTGRRKALLIADMESTIIEQEMLDELGREAGLGDRIADITERAMRGELDFEASLHERVALLEGLDEGAFDRVYDKIQLTPGVPIMVMTAQEHLDEIGLISGGFTQITDRLAEEYGIKREFTAANTLEVVDGRLTGRVTGPVIDRAAKATKLREFAARAGIPMDRTIAIGDGANDLDMIKAAGLGIAFDAKQVVRDAAPAAITRRDMTAVLYIRGIPQSAHRTSGEYGKIGAWNSGSGRRPSVTRGPSIG